MISTYISELLFEHDCVTVPSFGGFLAQYVGADIHPITHKFTPPSKKVAFNEQLKMNDGLLASTIAHRETISMEEAMISIVNFVAKLREEIEQSGVATLDNIGRFFMNSANRLEFEPDHKTNYLESTYGMGELFFKPIERNSDHMTKVPNKTIRPAVRKAEGASKSVSLDENGNPIPPKKKGAVKVLLILLPVILVIGAGGYWVYTQQGNPNMNFSSIISSLTGDSKSKKTADTTKLAAADTSSSAVADNAASGENVAETPEVVTESGQQDVVKNDKNATITLVKGRYYLIVGSFAHPKNATKLKDKLRAKGIQAHIIEPSSGKFHKVTVGNYGSKEAALIKKTELSADLGDDIWVMSN